MNRATCIFIGTNPLLPEYHMAQPHMNWQARRDSPITSLRSCFPIFAHFVHSIYGLQTIHCIVCDGLTLTGSNPRKDRLPGRPGGIRTPNMRFWRPPLYQLELLACNATLPNVFPDAAYAPCTICSTSCIQCAQGYSACFSWSCNYDVCTPYTPR